MSLIKRTLTGLALVMFSYLTPITSNVHAQQQFEQKPITQTVVTVQQPLEQIVSDAQLVKAVDEPYSKYTLIHAKQTHYNDAFYDTIRNSFQGLDKTAELYKASSLVLNSNKVSADLREKARKTNDNIKQYRESLAQILEKHESALFLINDSQAQIYSLASRLYDKKLISRIYLEGLNNEVGSGPIEVPKEIKQDYTSRVKNNITIAFRISQQDVEAKLPYIIGAGFKLNQDRQIPIYLADATYSQLNATTDTPHKELTQESVTEAREDITLKRIMSQDTIEGIGLLIYGAHHNFENNVRDWNAKNPTQKITLLTYEPTATKEYQRLISDLIKK